MHIQWIWPMKSSDVWINVDLLPFYPISPVGPNGTVEPNTNLSILTDSYAELLMYFKIATIGSVHEKFGINLIDISLT